MGLSSDTFFMEIYQLKLCLTFAHLPCKATSVKLENFYFKQDKWKNHPQSQVALSKREEGVEWRIYATFRLEKK